MGQWRSHRKLLARGRHASANICLPRLNKACPNPSKWRELLGIRVAWPDRVKDEVNASLHEVDLLDVEADECAYGQSPVAWAGEVVDRRSPCG